MLQSLRTVMTRTLALAALGGGLCLGFPTPTQAWQDTKPAAEAESDQRDRQCTARCSEQREPGAANNAGSRRHNHSLLHFVAVGEGW